mmetsp:Transcript_6609/g.26902  ORF Transcript_6609/g.26902 Transcript_6609/m.26902 type:complete len:258 (+) Transcript_6609:1195-1968(+)
MRLFRRSRLVMRLLLVAVLRRVDRRLAVERAGILAVHRAGLVGDAGESHLALRGHLGRLKVRLGVRQSLRRGGHDLLSLPPRLLLQCFLLFFILRLLLRLPLLLSSVVVLPLPRPGHLDGLRSRGLLDRFFDGLRSLAMMNGGGLNLRLLLLLSIARGADARARPPRANLPREALLRLGGPRLRLRLRLCRGFNGFNVDGFNRLRLLRLHGRRLRLGVDAGAPGGLGAVLSLGVLSLGVLGFRVLGFRVLGLPVRAG